jgi:hypothetical protein
MDLPEFQRLPLLTQTAYARLLDLLLTAEAGGLAPGSLVSKTTSSKTPSPARFWVVPASSSTCPGLAALPFTSWWLPRGVEHAPPRTAKRPRIGRKQARYSAC